MPLSDILGLYTKKECVCTFETKVIKAGFVFITLTCSTNSTPRFILF